MNNMAHSATDDFRTFLLKSAQGTPQQLKKRQKYEALPPFAKAGLYYQPIYANVRQQGVPQRISVCEILKNKGTRHFVNNNIEEAVQEYEKALSIFCFIENKNSRWRYEGIKDEDLLFKDQTGSTPEEKEQIRSLKLSLYLNLSICYLKMGDSKTCLVACEEALKIDPKSPKAYYRAAKALTDNEAATLKEYQKAEDYMKKACELEPDNLDVHQELARISKEVQRLQAEQPSLPSSSTNKKSSAAENKASMNKEKSKANVPNPKSVSQEQEKQQGTEERSKYLDKYEEAVKNKKIEDDSNEVFKMLHGGKNFNSYDYPLSYEVDPNAPVPEEIKELERFLDNRGKEILKIYEKTGKTKEAAHFKKQLEHARAAKKQLEKIAALDFNRPTEHLKSVAEKFGLDLRDPSIKNELRKIQTQNLKDIRAWIDGMSKQYTDKDKTAKESSKPSKKEETSKKSSKKTGEASSTNNYYINNNYYTTNIDNSQQYITNNQNSNIYHSTPDSSHPKESGLKKRYSDANDPRSNELKNKLGKPDNPDGSTRILNILIITVAIILFAVTIIIQTHSGTTHPTVPTKEI